MTYSENDQLTGPSESQPGTQPLLYTNQQFTLGDVKQQTGTPPLPYILTGPLWLAVTTQNDHSL